MVFIYVLKLEENKYYIGKTNNPAFRLDSHFSLNGSQWTKKYRPIKLLKMIPNCDDYDEDKITKQFMDKYGIDNFKIDLIKSYNVVRTHQKDHKHLEAYETLWICKTKNCVNKKLPFKPLKKEVQKQYREANKLKIAEKKKDYYENNKEKLLEKQKQYEKEYREKNKEKILERRNQKCKCECGGKYTYSSKARHLKSKKHQKKKKCEN